MDILQDILTFVMPIRIDSKERLRNVSSVISWLSELQCPIEIIEADSIKQISDDWIEKNKHIRYRFIKDNNKNFYRTHYINELLKTTKTEIVAIWDADIIIGYNQVFEAINNILSNNCILSYPYDGKYVMLNKDITEVFIKRNNIEILEQLGLKSIFSRPFCGGAYIVNRHKYLKIGGENENMKGWGPEDVERLMRVKILEENVKWTKSGSAYHLFHPRKENSNYFNMKSAIANRKELIKICNMDKRELESYILKWK